MALDIATKPANHLNWFEIPAVDLDRAKRFYESLFQITMQVEQFGPVTMAYFPVVDHTAGKLMGALAKSNEHRPSADGVMVYLNANPDLQAVIDRVAGAGGKVVQQKTHISPEIGYMAVFIDSEGNRVALHSNG